MICQIYIGKSLRLKCWLLFSFVWGNDLMYHVMYEDDGTFVETEESVYVQVVNEQALSKLEVVRLEDGGGLKFEPTQQRVQSSNQRFEVG
jgi:hypothetical protein